MRNLSEGQIANNHSRARCDLIEINVTQLNGDEGYAVKHTNAAFHRRHQRVEAGFSDNGRKMLSERGST
jgi:hypothetical protein